MTKLQSVRSCVLVLVVGAAPTFAQTAPQEQAAVPTQKEAPAATTLRFPPFASSYEGRWEMKIEGGMRTISNTNSLTIASKSETEAKGTYTSHTVGQRQCPFSDVPMVLRWLNYEEAVLVATHPNPSCGVRRFKLTREPSGRLIHRDNDSTTYFDPK